MTTTTSPPSARVQLVARPDAGQLLLDDVGLEHAAATVGGRTGARRPGRGGHGFSSGCRAAGRPRGQIEVERGGPRPRCVRTGTGTGRSAGRRPRITRPGDERATATSHRDEPAARAGRRGGAPDRGPGASASARRRSVDDAGAVDPHGPEHGGQRAPPTPERGPHPPSGGRGSRAQAPRIRRSTPFLRRIWLPGRATSYAETVSRRGVRGRRGRGSPRRSRRGGGARPPGSRGPARRRPG